MFARQRQGFEDQREKRLQAFTTGPATCTKDQHSSFKQKAKSTANPTSSSTGEASSSNLSTAPPKTGPMAKMETE